MFKILDVFSGPYAIFARIGVVLLIAAAVWAHGWFSGNEHGGQKLIDHIAKQATETVRIGSARERVVVKIQTEWRTRIEKVYLKGDLIEKEVPVYVTQEDSARCIIPNGFVRLHDAALANAPLTGGALSTDREDSGVSLPVVAETGAFNWKVCNLWRERALGWEAFYRGLKAVK